MMVGVRITKAPAAIKVKPTNLNLEESPCFVPTQVPIVEQYKKPFNRTHFRGRSVSIIGMKEKLWVVVSKYIGKVSDKTIICAR